MQGKAVEIPIHWVCYLSSPFEWREIHCNTHSWTVICISQVGEKEMDWQGEKGNGKGIMEKEKIESERRRVGLHFVREQSGDGEWKLDLKGLTAAVVFVGVPGSCYLWRSLKRLCSDELSHVMFSFCLSCFFSSPLIHASTRPSKMATVQRLLEKTTSPSLEWPVEMTAAFVGVSSSS